MNYIYAAVITVSIVVALYQWWIISGLRKLNGQLSFMHDEDDTMFVRLKTVIEYDMHKFLKSMTRDELAAYEGRKTVSDNLESAIGTILSEWHEMRGAMLTAQAAANSAAVRDLQHGALQEANAELVEIIAGVRNRLSTSPDSPFGVYTGRFPTFSRLCLFLVDQALRAQAPPESQK